ncbi:MAG: hypothetical protein K2X08_06435 [Chlamydiales bacterium]|nr:hypothetical protein [Chlamydiales bacterium]
MNYISNFSCHVSGVNINSLFDENDESSGKIGHALLVGIAGIALVTIAAYMYLRYELTCGEERVARLEEGIARDEEAVTRIEQLREHIIAIRRNRQEREAHPFGRMRGHDCDFRLSRN